MTDGEAQVRWLVEWARAQGTLGEWSLLYNAELLLLELACAAPLEDTRWSRLAFDVECRLGELDAADATLAEHGLVLNLDAAGPPGLHTVAAALLWSATKRHASEARASVDPSARSPSSRHGPGTIARTRTTTP